MSENITQFDVDYLADILWWCKGYIAGARENFEQCPFNESHVEALRKARVVLLPMVSESEEGGR